MSAGCVAKVSLQSGWCILHTQWQSRHAQWLVQACKDEPGAVQQAYDALLDRPGGDQHNPDVRAPVMRIRILKSLHAVLLARQSVVERDSHFNTYQMYKAKQRHEVGLFPALLLDIVHASCCLVHTLEVMTHWTLSHVHMRLQVEIKYDHAS